MATVHHRRVVTVPTPTWYRERQGSHNRKSVTCGARNTQYSSALYSAATLPQAVSSRLGEMATSFPARFAQPRVGYSAASHPQPRIDYYCSPLGLTATPPVKKSGILGLSCCWSPPAELLEHFLLREAPQKLHASHEPVPTMKNCQPLLKEQKQDPLFFISSPTHYKKKMLTQNSVLGTFFLCGIRDIVLDIGKYEFLVLGTLSLIPKFFPVITRHLHSNWN